MNKNFVEGFEKVAKKEENHQLRRALIGNPISSAIESKKGKKWESFKDAWKHQFVEGAKGLGIGAASGGAIGAMTKLHPKLRHIPTKNLAIIGAGVGSNVGATAGVIKGTHDSRATEIHNKHSKNK